MPRIKEYTSQVEAPGPVAGRRHYGEEINPANGLSELGRAVSQTSDMLYKYAEQAEVSDITAKMAEAHATFTKDWQDRISKADPSDNTVADTFIKDVGDHMGKLSENVKTAAGREYFTRAASQMQGHFAESAVMGQADLAGIKARQDYTQTINNLSSGLLNDPSSFDTAMQLHSDGIDNLVKTGRLPQEVALQLKTKGESTLAESTIRGFIKVKPDYAIEQMSSGRWDKLIGGDVKAQLYGEAKVAIRGDEVEEERKRREAERVKTEQQNATQNDFLSKMAQDKLSVKDILNSNLDAFGSGSKEQFIRLLEQHDSDKEKRIKTDPGVFMDVWSRIHAPDEDPKKIRDENELNGLLGRGLTLENINQLRAEIQGKKTQEGQIESTLKDGVIKIASGALTKTNPLLGIRDADGDEQMQKFMGFFLTEYDKQRKAGKTPLELLSPESPSYLGKHIRAYVRTPEQIIKGLSRQSVGSSEGLSTPPSPTSSPAPAKTKPPRLENESPADYLKRTGGP